MKERKLISRRGILALLALGILCGAVFFAFSRLPAGVTAVVEVNGQECERVNLASLSEPVEKEITGENGILLTLRFEPDGAQVLESQCPDKICVHTGKLRRAGESAICLPARTVLRLEGENAVDGVTG